MHLHRTRPCVTVALLLLVAWSRAWAGVPELVVHTDPAGQSAHEEVCDHLLSVSAAADEHVTGDDAEHQHHLHICGCGVALVSALELGWSALIGYAVVPRQIMAPVDRGESFLRPPIS